MKLRHIFFISFFIGIIGSVSVGLYAYDWYATPVKPKSTQKETFIVPKGQAISVIGERLYEGGFIKHPLLFRVAVKQLDLSDKIQAGSFEISAGMPVAQIAIALTQGTQDTWVTIVEGWRMEQIAESIDKLDLPLFDVDEFKNLVVSNQSEGMLFPDTYLIPKQYDAEQIYSLLTNTFEQKVIKELEDEIEKSPYTLDEVLIMASLVEREARGYDEMRGVAGVLWKRIEIGMPLQVDATMQYAKGFDKIQQTWWASPLAADKTINSPFNTYLVQGLPPAPISNPGFEAISAALRPIETNNLFYIHDKDGMIHYAETLEGHNANVNRYLR